jgi:hypothetical protein
MGSQIVVTLSALSAGHHLPPEDYSYSFLLKTESTSGP